MKETHFYLVHLFENLHTLHTSPDLICNMQDSKAQHTFPKNRETILNHDFVKIIKLLELTLNYLFLI